MVDDLSTNDPHLGELLERYTDVEAAEIQSYLLEWQSGTYDSVAHSVMHHAKRKAFDPLEISP